MLMKQWRLPVTLVIIPLILFILAIESELIAYLMKIAVF